MKTLITTTVTAIALGLGATSISANDFSDDLDGVRSSIAAIERQLDSMDVNYNKTEINTGLNRTQELRALEAKYDSLQAIFQNNHVEN
ncbi:hypothetical protein [Marinomonas sp. PE14-40]|uniref:hypothetical protein n=1 Tax=Marinomonas sp. PE14-40 TaxID=3060621 RepID=UPI003F678697